MLTIDEFDYNSLQFEGDAEWMEAITLHRWRCYINKGHYVRKGKTIYFDTFIYNLIESEIEYRRNCKQKD